MKVSLSSLKPNPYRDFTVDPIDKAAVAGLVESIREDGFWGGIVCRKSGGDIQIACGHHRVEAAISIGITHADVTVGEFDDEAMVRIYARENATQRGNNSTSVAGSVAGAIRLLAHRVLSGESFAPEFRSEKRGAKIGDQSIGEPAISECLKDVPSVTKNSVGQQLKSLKASGDYGRIIHEVQIKVDAELAEKQEALRLEAEQAEQEEQERLEQEQEAIRAQRDKAEKQSAKASEQERTFDFEGVSRHLSSSHQVEAFRDIALSVGVRDRLPVENQADVAEALVSAAKERKVELSGAFIKKYFVEKLMGLFKTEQSAKQEEGKEELARMDRQQKMERAQREFSRSAGTMAKHGGEIADLYRNWPNVEPVPFSGEFQSALEKLSSIVALLSRVGVIK